MRKWPGQDWNSSSLCLEPRHLPVVWGSQHGGKPEVYALRSAGETISIFLDKMCSNLGARVIEQGSGTGYGTHVPAHTLIYTWSLGVVPFHYGLRSCVCSAVFALLMLKVFALLPAFLVPWVLLSRLESISPVYLALPSRKAEEPCL